MLQLDGGIAPNKKAHGDAHPEELGGLKPAVFFGRFVDDEVSVLERLDTEEVEVHVGRRVEGGGQFIEIVIK